MNLKRYIFSDLYRYKEKTNFKIFLKTYFSSVGFNYLVWFRITQRYNNIFTRYLLKRKMIKFGIEIHPKTQIGYGFYIGHWGGIVIRQNSAIGANAVVVKDVLPDTTVGGIPAKEISNIGSNGYLNRLWKELD
jgi:serine O-acetyltransferase